MLSLTVHEHGGLREGERLTFTSISLPCLSFRRKEESSPSWLGLEETPKPWQKGKSGFPCPVVTWGGSRQVENQSRSFKQPASHCPFQMFYLSICYIPSAGVRRHQDHLALHPHQALKETLGPSHLPRRTSSTQLAPE